MTESRDLPAATDAPRPGDVMLIAGTKKGLFLLWSDPERRQWRQARHHAGWAVHAATYDPRDGHLYCATKSEVFGVLVRRSPDLGATWAEDNEGLAYAAEDARRVRTIWQLAPGARPGTVLAGVEHAGLFRSTDHGRHWAPLTGLNDHPTAADWQPGGGGLCLHTIVTDEAGRIWVAISTGGVYRSEDGGETWQPRNRGISAGFLPGEEPTHGQCVHKVDRHPAVPDRLYAQNHGGVYRSDDGGDSWLDIAEGLPSDFGFPLCVDPNDPDTVYIVPLEADIDRVTAQGRMAVWRSRDAGASWQACTEGLPDPAHLVILRDAMACDDLLSTGVYVGTTTGQIFHSRDHGDTWGALADYLPPVYCLGAFRVAAPASRG